MTTNEPTDKLWDIKGDLCVTVKITIGRIRGRRFSPSWKHRRLFAPPEVVLYVPASKNGTVIADAARATSGDNLFITNNLDVVNTPKPKPWFGLGVE